MLTRRYSGACLARRSAVGLTAPDYASCVCPGLCVQVIINGERVCNSYSLLHLFSASRLEATWDSLADSVGISSCQYRPCRCPGTNAMLWVLVLGLAQLVAAVAAQNYSICHEFAGNDFFDYFYFWKYADPTRGKVDYVDKKTAKHLNLSYVDPDTGRFVMQVDYAGEAVPINGNQSDLGRRSTRIHSDYLYGDGVYILKATWMPQGCAYVLTLTQYLACLLD